MMRLDAVGLVRMRLGEHVLHTWDVAVMADPAATVQAAAVDLLIDNVPQFLAPRLGKPLAEPFSVRITTTDPARDYLLTSGESITVTDWPGEGGAVGDVPHVTMPAEALLRLSYGRLDPEHTPSSVSADPEVLDKLRQSSRASSRESAADAARLRRAHPARRVPGRPRPPRNPRTA